MFGCRDCCTVCTYSFNVWKVVYKKVSKVSVWLDEHQYCSAEILQC